MGFPLDLSWPGPAPPPPVAAPPPHPAPGPGPTLAWSPAVGTRVFGPRSPGAGERPCLPPLPLSPLSFLYTGFLSLRSENVLVLALGIIILGVCHYTLTVKGSHLATHGALTESKRWSRIWELFFVEVSLGGVGVAAGTSCGGHHCSATASGGVRLCAHAEGPLQPSACVSEHTACSTVSQVYVCVCLSPSP